MFKGTTDSERKDHLKKVVKGAVDVALHATQGVPGGPGSEAIGRIATMLVQEAFKNPTLLSTLSA